MGYHWNHSIRDDTREQPGGRCGAGIARGLGVSIGDPAIYAERAAYIRAHAAPWRVKHPFVRWITASRQTVSAWAAGHGLKLGRVSSWMARGRGRRQCPPDWALRIEAESRGAVPRACWL